MELNYKIIDNVTAARKAIVHLARGPNLYLDAETTGPKSQDGGLCPHEGRLRLLQMQNGDSKIFVVDCYKVDPRLFKELIEGKEKVIGHNIKFDAKFLRKYGILVENLWDTMIASQIFTAGYKGIKHGLGYVLEDVLGVEVDKSAQKSDWFPAVLATEQIDYAARDVLWLPSLHKELLNVCREDDLLTTLALDMQVIAPAAWMEYAGVRLDLDALPAAVQASATHLEKLRQRCIKYAKDETFNPGSSQQVKAFFHKFKKYQGLDSFKKEVLENLDHPMAEPLLEYRAVKKLLGSYLQKFPNHINPITGNIHCSINIDPTATGRMSTSSMSLQNIPGVGESGKMVRRMFIPERGMMVLVADYSQIELRIMALMSRDPKMVQAYIDGIDIHTLTTQEVFKVTPEHQDWDDFRHSGKTANFSLAYGITPERLAAKSNGFLTVKQAEALKTGWFDTYKGVTRLFDEIVSEAFRTRESRTLLGRRRAYPSDGRSWASIRRQAQNHIIQGTSADMMKAAIVEAWRMGLDLRLTVHDELICYSPADRVEEDASKLEMAMIRGAEKVLDHALRKIDRRVPILADAGYGMSWGEAKGKPAKTPAVV